MHSNCRVRKIITKLLMTGNFFFLVFKITISKISLGVLITLAFLARSSKTEIQPVLTGRTGPAVE